MRNCSAFIECFESEHLITKSGRLSWSKRHCIRLSWRRRSYGRSRFSRAWLYIGDIGCTVPLEERIESRVKSTYKLEMGKDCFENFVERPAAAGPDVFGFPAVWKILSILGLDG